jgi:hypothetical protein
MKKIFLIVVAGIVYVTSAKAQLQKGNVLVGSDIANFSFDLNSGSSFNIDIDPKAAWFVKDNLAFGGYVNLDFVGAKGSSTTTNYGVGPLLRYYVNDPSIEPMRHVRFFVEANAGIEGTDNSGAGGNTNGLGIGFGPGIAYFITNTIGLEGLLKYNGIVGFGSDPYTSALGFNFGFQVYLPGKSTLKNVKNNMKR